MHRELQTGRVIGSVNSCFESREGFSLVGSAWCRGGTVWSGCFSTRRPRAEQVDARDMVVEATHPVYGTVQLVNNATGFSGPRMRPLHRCTPSTVEKFSVMF